MHWIPCEKDKDPTDMSKVYPSPIYKTSERKAPSPALPHFTCQGVLSTTGHSTNFVCTIKIPIVGASRAKLLTRLQTEAPEHTAKFWVKRGVACLCGLAVALPNGHTT